MSYLYRQIATETKCIPGCYNIPDTKNIYNMFNTFNTCCPLHDLIKESISRTVIPSKPICLYDNCTVVADKGQITCYQHKALFSEWFDGSYFLGKAPVLCNWNNCNNEVEEGNYSMCCSSDHSKLYHKYPMQMSSRCNYYNCTIRPTSGNYCCDDHKTRKEYYDEVDAYVDEQYPYIVDTYVDDQDYENDRYQQEQAKLRQIARARERRTISGRVDPYSDISEANQEKLDKSDLDHSKKENESADSNPYADEDRIIAEQEALDIKRAEELSRSDAQHFMEEQERKDLELAEQLSCDYSENNSNPSPSDLVGEMPELEYEGYES
jgi:hypothetical protein